MAMYNINEQEATLHISKGNGKIGNGIWSFSTLPGNAEHTPMIGGNPLTNITGTCSKYCENCARDGACYAWRDAKLHHNVVAKAWGDNTVLLRNGKLWSLLDEFLWQKNRKSKKILDKWLAEFDTQPDEIWPSTLTDMKHAAVVKMFRIHVSGEIEDLHELKQWDALARRHPETTFALYTKNYDALGEYLDHTKGITPPNLVINVSEWHGVAAEFLRKYTAKYPGAFNVFEYDDHNKRTCDLPAKEVLRLEKLTHCPAVDRNGHHVKTPAGKPLTCDKCRKCYMKTGAWTAVWSH